MNVELIEDEEPPGLRIGGNGAGNMPRKVFFRSAGSDGRCHAFPSRHVEIGDQALRPMAEVFILGALDEAGLHAQGGGRTLQRLYPGLLIRTDDMTSVLGYGWRMRIRFTHGSHLGGKCDGGSRLGVEPVLDPMGLQIRLILKTARHCGC
jgi:hypothetical protein